MKKRAKRLHDDHDADIGVTGRNVGQEEKSSFLWVSGLAIFALTFCAGVGLRLVELPMWLAGDFRIQDQWLMATHDAYHWLSGTEGGPTVGRALPRLMLFLSALTGVAPANIGFWLPVFIAPLAALPVCLVAARWRLPEAGLWAGLMAVAAPGYLHRTRMGFLDDDLFVIPMVLVLIAGFVLWLTPYCREAWARSNGDEPELSTRHAGLLLAGGLALGLWARLCVFVYHKGFALVLLIVVLGVVLGVILVRARVRAMMVAALILLLAAWFVGPVLLLMILTAVAGATYMLRTDQLQWMATFRLPGPAVLAPLILVALTVVAFWGRALWLPGVMRTWNTVSSYFIAAFSGQTEQMARLGTVAEALGLSAWATAQLLCGHWITAILATFGFCLLVWKRPLAAMFLPLGAIALGAFFLGARFTVISGAFFGLGLGCGAVLVLERMRVAIWKRWLVLIVLLPLVFWYSWMHVRTMKPEPVVSPHQAEALLKLRDIAAEDALIWNWWDLGHATLYYTARPVVERASPSGNYARAVTVDSAEALRGRVMGRGGKLDHYVVVSWDLLETVDSLIARGASLIQGEGGPRQGQIQKLTGGFEFDLNQGALIAPGQIIPLRSLLVIEPTGPRRHSWPWNRQGGHVVLNMFDRTGYLMDQVVHDTMFVRMLLGPGEDFADDFDLVVDDFPWVRVYRVRDGR